MNTKLTFFWTSAEHDTFTKTIFQAVVKNKFESSYDAQNWMDNNISYIFDKFDFSLVFDHVLVSFEDTDEVITDIEIVKTFSGKLVFSDHKDLEIEQLKEELKVLKEKLEIETLKRETKEIKDEIEVIKKDIDEENKDYEDSKKQYQSCWIDPSGKRYNVGFACHNEFAFDMLQSRYKMTTDELCFGVKYAYEILQDKGWVRILGWSRNGPSFIIPDKLTPKMKKSIKDYCHDQGCRYPNEINID